MIERFPNTSTEEQRFLYLTDIDKTRRDVSLANEAHKKHVKVEYDKSVKPHAFNEDDLVLTYDQIMTN